MLLNRERAEDQMCREGVDALVCVLPKNVYYLSDYESDWLFDVPWAACAVLPRDRSLPPTLIVHDVEATNLASCPSWMPQLRVYRARLCGETVSHYAIDDAVELLPEELAAVAILERTAATAEPGLMQAVERALGDLQLLNATLAFDEPRLQTIMQSVLSAARCVDGAWLMNRIRAVKSEAEIALMREAARRNQSALGAAISAVAPGAQWYDVCVAYEHAPVDLDCRPFCFYVGAGRRSTGLRRERHYPLKRGDQVCFDSMMTFERYFGDAQRTCVVGEPTPKLLAYWAALSAAAEECYGLMAPGVNTATLRGRAVDIARRGGIRSFRHAFVHGLGLDHIEVPGAAGFDGFELEAGMVVNMDLEVCELGFGGVYFEESMLITKTGAERLYSTPRELIVVDGAEGR